MPRFAGPNFSGVSTWPLYTTTVLLYFESPCIRSVYNRFCQLSLNGTRSCLAFVVSYMCIIAYFGEKSRPIGEHSLKFVDLFLLRCSVICLSFCHCRTRFFSTVHVTDFGVRSPVPRYNRLSTFFTVLHCCHSLPRSIRR